MNKLTPESLLLMGQFICERLQSIIQDLRKGDYALALYSTGYMAGLTVQKSSDLESEDMGGTGISYRQLRDIEVVIVCNAQDVRDQVISGNTALAIQILEHTYEQISDKMSRYAEYQKEVSE